MTGLSHFDVRVIVIDDESIAEYFILRELPLELPINQGGASGSSLDYSWWINFDTGSDRNLEHDIPRRITGMPKRERRNQMHMSMAVNPSPWHTSIR